MVNEKLAMRFEKYSDEFGRFYKVENKLHPRPDMCAMLLLEKIAPVVPPFRELLDGADRSVVYFATDCDAFSAVATNEDIVTLVRCGLHFCVYANCFARFL